MYEWLMYDKEKELMTCKFCIKYQSSGNFVAGCSNFKKSTLHIHDDCQAHKDSALRAKAETRAPGSSVAEKACESLNRTAFNKLTLLFRNAHFVAKSGRPFTDYVKLCNLDRAKGLEIGETYVTDKYCQTFVRAITDCERAKQDDVVSRSPFLSVIPDGSTDSSSTEAEICYVRVSVGCEFSTHFIGVKSVHKADARTISESLMELLDDRFGQEWRKKIVSIGTDGAAVMVGAKGGVVQRIRNTLDRQSIFAVHCSAHRLL